MYETIKKFLSEGGKCLLIENGKPVGVVLTMEEYEKLKSKLEVPNQKSEKDAPAPTLRLPTSEVGAPIPTQGREADQGVGSESVGAELADFDLEDDVTLEDLGLDELPN